MVTWRTVARHGLEPDQTSQLDERGMCPSRSPAAPRTSITTPTSDPNPLLSCRFGVMSVAHGERRSELGGCDLSRVVSEPVQEHLSGEQAYRVVPVIDARHRRSGRGLTRRGVLLTTTVTKTGLRQALSTALARWRHPNASARNARTPARSCGSPTPMDSGSPRLSPTPHADSWPIWNYATAAGPAPRTVSAARSPPG